MPPKVICVYHKSDLDGVCSAAVVLHFMKDVEFIGMDYGGPFPWDKIENGATVYMVDFSLKPDDMKRLAEISNLVWIDHHKSAIEAMSTTGLDPAGMRDTGYAACELAWAWLSLNATNRAVLGRGHCPDDVKFVEAPTAVSLLGRYDAWKSSDPEWESKILPFQYGARSVEGIYNPEDPAWPALFSFMPPDKDGYVWRNRGEENLPRVFEVGIGDLTEYGRSIIRYLGMERREQMLRCGFETTVEGFRAICCNTASPGSGTFDGFYDPEKHDVMICFMQRSDGRWRHGIYTTKPDVDCSAIAKKFGGGGHQKAAGCETEAPIVHPHSSRYGCSA